MTQMELAKELGVTFQQVQKYENGTNRIGASRLVQIAQALNMAVEHLFEGLGGARKSTAADPNALLSNGHAVRLAQAFSQISDRQTRLALVTLAERIVAGRPA